MSESPFPLYIHHTSRVTQLVGRYPRLDVQLVQEISVIPWEQTLRYWKLSDVRTSMDVMISLVRLLKVFSQDLDLLAAHCSIKTVRSQIVESTAYMFDVHFSQNMILTKIRTYSYST